MEEENLKQQLLLQVKLEEGGHDRAGEGYGITCVFVFSIFISVCGSFSGGCAMGYSSPVQSGILADLEISTADYSLFVSMLTIGGLLGSLFCGKLADYIGRRCTMGLSSLLGIIGWLAIAFSEAAWSLVLGRLSLGISMGITVYAVPVFIAEITPKNLRGGSVLIHQLMMSLGIALAYLVGLITTWRILALIGVLPCLIQLLGLFFIPESPRWLVKISSDHGYKDSLQRLRGKNVDISLEATEIQEYTKAVENILEDSLFKVFQMKYAYALTVSLGLMALGALGGTNGVLFYATTTFQSAGFSATVGTVAMALIQLPPTFLGVFSMDKFGRRPLLLFSVTGMGTACLLVALSFLFKENGWMTDFSPYLALIGILMFSACFPVGMGGIPSVIMSEIFPIIIKGAAGSLATVVSWSSSWIVSYSFNFMMNWSPSGAFFIFTGVNIFSLLFVLKIVPETKGHTLEEIQEAVTHTLY